MINNNRRARRDFKSCKKVKTHVAQIINMHKVTPRSIAYASCQVSGNFLFSLLNTKTMYQLQFALSSVTSWRSVDGDFDYVPFWQNIVDFFERPPGHIAQKKVDQLLAWWTRYIHYTLNDPRLTFISQESFRNKPPCGTY